MAEKIIELLSHKKFMKNIQEKLEKLQLIMIRIL